jgi:hypothetical protein
VIAADALGKAQVGQQRTQVSESDVRIRVATENAVKCLRDLAHGSLAR